MPYSYTHAEELHPRCTSTLRGTAGLQGTATPTRCSYAYEVQLHLRGAATPYKVWLALKSYSYTFEAQPHLLVTALLPLKNYSDTFEVQLHLTGTALHYRGKAAVPRHSYTYEAQLHLRGKATPTRYRLHLRHTG